MLQLLKNPKFDFMKRGPLLLAVSTVLVAISIGVMVALGFNLGVEFAGGTEVQVRFADQRDVAAVRSSLSSAGFERVRVSTIKDPDSPDQLDIYIRLPSAADPGEEANVTSEVTRALRGTGLTADSIDLNVADSAILRKTLEGAPGVSVVDAETLATAILYQRREVVIFGSYEELAGIPLMTPAVLDHLRNHAELGPLAIRSQSYIGPAIGRELRNNAVMAGVFSLLGMLAYIWFRFQLQWGLAAVLALTHDTLITLGLFSLFRMELSLPVVAAFLTLVGYSVNDTVVVFDRIRENLKNRVKPTLNETINLSINQTLSRTIITSGLTWVVVFGLFVYGGSPLRAFSFVLSVGVVVGTYSSIYIACPLLMLWQRLTTKGAEAAVSGGDSRRPARKVRTSGQA